jgi:hypothetical protein
VSEPIGSATRRPSRAPRPSPRLLAPTKPSTPPGGKSQVEATIAGYGRFDSIAASTSPARSGRSWPRMAMAGRHDHVATGRIGGHGASRARSPERLPRPDQGLCDRSCEGRTLRQRLGAEDLHADADTTRRGGACRYAEARRPVGTGARSWLSVAASAIPSPEACSRRLAHESARLRSARKAHLRHRAGPESPLGYRLVSIDQFEPHFFEHARDAIDAAQSGASRPRNLHTRSKRRSFAVTTNVSTRIDHFAWVVSPENTDGYLQRLYELFGVRLLKHPKPVSLGPESGCYISFVDLLRRRPRAGRAQRRPDADGAEVHRRAGDQG